MTERAAFFHFLAVAEGKQNDEDMEIFTMAQLDVEKAKVDNSFLLLIQSALFNSWLDKLRVCSTETTLAMLSSLPTTLDVLDALRPVPVHVVCTDSTVW